MKTKKVGWTKEGKMVRVLGFVDKRWKPKRKSPLEVQIEREDMAYWCDKEEKPLEYVYKPNEFHLTETAKHVFGSAVHLFNSMMP
jgi:hypothetical protein